MGNVSSICGENIFGQLKDKYGQDFIKLIVAEKSKEVVNEKFSEFNRQAEETFSGFENKTTNIVEQKSSALK